MSELQEMIQIRELNVHNLKFDRGAVVLYNNLKDSYPVPSGAIDQFLGMKFTFLQPHGEQNQEVWEITGQDATSKPFISVKTKGFLRPRIHQGQPEPRTAIAPQHLW